MGERKREKHQCVVASRTPPTGDPASNPGMYPDWDWDWHRQPFGLQACTQSTEPHQPGLDLLFHLFMHSFVDSFLKDFIYLFF